MKLATNLGIATAGVALCFAAVSKPAQAASVVFQGQSGNRYDYAIEFDSANLPGDFERLRTGSLWYLEGLFGVTGATVANPSRASVLGTTTESAVFQNINFAANGKVDTLAPTLYFSIFSSATKTALVDWSLIRRNPGTFSERLTEFSGQVLGPAVPEPFTIGGSAIALGFGFWMKRKQAASQKA
ncbi:MAG: PEP-CTERM sorting domain-containing protein [Desmonostoc vinosum HA7617-LM4]|jgi:hypothetical protein|nr:PEP-CTERM sorting domain-containing protein [Desmonostoc vinosum HA7617-LM4]